MQRLPSVIVPLFLAITSMAGLTFCASSTPTTYADGPMVRPPVRVAPSYAPPGTGLPEYFPGEPEPSYPRAPPGQRLLPQTPQTRRETTIWASETPPDALGDEPRLLGYILPIEPGPEPKKRLEIPRRCARLMQRAVDLWGYESKLADPRLKRCLAAELFRLCVNHYSDKNHPEYGAVHYAMSAFYDRSCVGMAHSEELDNRFTGIQAKVERALKEMGP